jgi:GT2 family glycosyltransferase
LNSLLQLWPDAIKKPYRRARAWALSVDLDPHRAFELSPGERAASSRISVVVPVHDAPVATSRCVSALRALAGGAEVILVDDGSSTAEVRTLLAQAVSEHGWTLVRHEQPVGHSRACEAGVSKSTRPYICLLNSDAIVTHKSWAAIVDAFHSSPAIAIVGPSTSYTAGPQVVRRAMHCRHYWSNEQIWSFADRYVAQHRHAALVERPFVGGFAFFVRRAAWDALGGFDTNLPDYGNEKEFCRRAVGAGLRIVWAQGSYIHHLGRETYGRTRSLATIHQHSAQADEYIERKHGR